MSTDPEDLDEALLVILERARAVGFLGPGPLRAQAEHALAFARALPPGAAQLVDLGSGGGLPALPVLVASPGMTGVLVESMEKRAVFLTWAVAELGLAHRVTVRRQRAEDAAHDPELRGTADVVTARGFAAPGITAECAVGFLRVGGVLIVSEPPDRPARWPQEGLDRVGLEAPATLGSVVRLRLTQPVPDELPRSARAIAKRPLF